MVAHSRNSGGRPFSEGFNPLNSGLYITHTNLCNDARTCEAPVKSIQILGEPVGGGFGILGTQDRAYMGYLTTGFGEIASAFLEEDAKKLSIVPKSPRENKNSQFYIPSMVINGDFTIFVDGVQFYPPQSDNTGIGSCQSVLSEHDCRAVYVELTKIDGWSIARIFDSRTSSSRDTQVIEIVGTTAIPEFVTSTAAIAMGLTIALMVRTRMIGPPDPSMTLNP